MALADPDLSGSTAFITGTTRGIGKQIALALADRGCNIVSTGKTTDDDDSDLDGSIEQTAREVRDRGAEALALELDLRDETRVKSVVEEAIDRFGEVDIVINNASAIQLANVADLPANRFDLLTDVNVRGPTSSRTPRRPPRGARRGVAAVELAAGRDRSLAGEGAVRVGEARDVVHHARSPKNWLATTSAVTRSGR